MLKECLRNLLQLIVDGNSANKKQKKASLKIMALVAAAETAAATIKAYKEGGVFPMNLLAGASVNFS